MSDPKNYLESDNKDIKKIWIIMSYYDRFEHIVASVLRVVISIIIVVALWRLIYEVFYLLILGILNPLDHKVFQYIFGMIMTLLIAMEFKHSILKAYERGAHIIQVKTVILIAQLALARKFIIMDFAAVEAAKLAAVGFAVLVLGIVYWLLNDQELRRNITKTT